MISMPLIFVTIVHGFVTRGRGIPGPMTIVSAAQRDRSRDHRHRGGERDGCCRRYAVASVHGLFVSNAAIDALGNVSTSEAGAAVVNQAAASCYLFPALFITIACGAISRFRVLVLRSHLQAA